MYIDSHAHLSSEKLFNDSQEVIKRARSVGIEVILNICTDQSSLEKGLILKENYPEIFLASSATPHDTEEEADQFFLSVEKAAQENKLVAIGETGLDYHYQYCPKDSQKKRLIKYFDLAKKQNLPIIFHCREAFSDLFALAKKEYLNKPALLHCFTGTLDEAKQVLDLGWLISFSGIITFKKSEALREVVSYVPLDRMVIETDSPYLAPNSKRGKVNEPSFIPEIAEMIANIKGIPLQKVANNTKKNAKAFFLI